MVWKSEKEWLGSVAERGDEQAREEERLLRHRTFLRYTFIGSYRVYSLAHWRVFCELERSPTVSVAWLTIVRSFLFVVNELVNEWRRFTSLLLLLLLYYFVLRLFSTNDACNASHHVKRLNEQKNWVHSVWNGQNLFCVVHCFESMHFMYTRLVWNFIISSLCRFDD